MASDNWSAENKHVGTSNPRVRGIENCIVGNVATNASTESTKDRTMLIGERNNTRECSRDQITVQIVRLKDYSLIVARTRLCTNEIGLFTLYLRCALVQKFRTPICPSTWQRRNWRRLRNRAKLMLLPVVEYSTAVRNIGLGEFVIIREDSRIVTD